ncbi:MAG: 5-formyltetrahydrofolate cyclo-ligase [Oscillospiraceae bacterium]|nr:5-formyltetrahydrofolate cyclo-ligase [Oscillospiraceae bacterium]
MNNSSELQIRRLTITAMMIALQIVLSRYLAISFLTYKIGFYFLPMVVVGMLYGPVYSGIAWGLSDIIGALLFPTGPFFFGFTLSAILNGVIFGLLLYKNHTKLFRILSAVVIASTVVSIGCDSLWLKIYFPTIGLNRLTIAIFTDRMIRSAIMAPVQFITILLIAKTLGEVIYRNSSVFYEKKAIRQEARAYYNSRFISERNTVSREILDHLIQLEQYIAAENIFCYIGRKSEIDTSLIIEQALKDKKTVSLPLCASDGSMTARVISSLEDVTIGSFGILEPQLGSDILPRDDIDLALIPCLVSDNKGHRIGFGGGYYDRYLAKSKMYKIILCPAEMVREKIPVTGFDLKADLVLS